MSLSFWFNSLYLSLSIILTYFWTQNPQLNRYNLQLTAVFIIAYFAYRFTLKRRSTGSLTPSTIILATIINLVIFSSGGLTSPLFFLFNFLLFAIALLLSPWHAILATFFLTLILSLSVNFNFDNNQIVNLISLILTTPIAIIFGRSYLISQASQGKITLLEQTLEEDETNTLIWLSTKAKPSLTLMIETTSEIIATNKLPFYLQEKLKNTYQDLISLHQSANQLQTSVDKEETV